MTRKEEDVLKYLTRLAVASGDLKKITIKLEHDESTRDTAARLSDDIAEIDKCIYETYKKLTLGDTSDD